MFRSFQTRLVVTFLTLLAVVEVLTVALVYTATKQRILDNSRAELVAASYQFRGWLDDTRQRLTESAHLLASDFGFRGAVATRDHNTVGSALDNLRKRIGAERALLIDLGGTVTIDTYGPAGRAFRFTGLLEQAEREFESAATVVLEDRIYELVVVPVLAPDPVAWVGIAAEIDDARLAVMREQASIPLDVTFVYSRANLTWQPVASTLERGKLAEIPRVLHATPPPADERSAVRNTQLDGVQYASLTDCLPASAGSSRVCAVIQHSLRLALVPYRQLFYFLAIIGVLGILLTLLGCMVIARSISHPLRALDQAAQRIRFGDYTSKIAIGGKDELNRLGQTFNEMMDGIARREDRIAFQFKHDILTRLPNRLYFEQKLSMLLAARRGHEQRFSILLLDIERFSEINNTLGHDVGDQLLKDISKRLVGSLKKDDLIARVANSSFVVLLQETDASQAMPVIQRLLGTFESAFAISGLKVDVGVRMGLSSFPDHGQDSRSLLRCAEVALASAKGSISRYAVYDPKSDPYQPEMLSMMSDLRAGLERGEFVLHYQPKIDLVNGEVDHVEALIRWNHGQYGFMPPDKFVPLAEQTGYINLLTQFVIRTALRDCANWHATGFDVGVAINLSVKDLLDTQVAKSLATALAVNKLEARYVTLEITESAVMEQPKESLEQLDVLAALGVNIAIDDYGTGYSSMAYVKRLPVNELKIDKVFVTDLTTDKEDEIIVHSTIELGHNLGLKVTAEGVEDSESVAKLKVFGCDYAQGYHFSKPLERRELVRFMKANHERVIDQSSATIHRLPHAT